MDHKVKDLGYMLSLNGGRIQPVEWDVEPDVASWIEAGALERPKILVVSLPVHYLPSLLEICRVIYTPSMLYSR